MLSTKVTDHGTSVMKVVIQGAEIPRPPATPVVAPCSALSKRIALQLQHSCIIMPAVG